MDLDRSNPTTAVAQFEHDGDGQQSVYSGSEDGVEEVLRSDPLKLPPIQTQATWTQVPQGNANFSHDEHGTNSLTYPDSYQTRGSPDARIPSTEEYSQTFMGSALLITPFDPTHLPAPQEPPFNNVMLLPALTQMNTHPVSVTSYPQNRWDMPRSGDGAETGYRNEYYQPQQPFHGTVPEDPWPKEEPDQTPSNVRSTPSSVWDGKHDFGNPFVPDDAQSFAPTASHAGSFGNSTRGQSIGAMPPPFKYQRTNDTRILGKMTLSNPDGTNENKYTLNHLVTPSQAKRVRALFTEIQNGDDCELQYR